MPVYGPGPPHARSSGRSQVEARGAAATLAGHAWLNGYSAPRLMAATVVAPTIGAAVAGGLGSYPALFLALAGASVISGVLMIGTGMGAGP